MYSQQMALVDIAMPLAWQLSLRSVVKPLYAQVVPCYLFSKCQALSQHF